MLVGSDPASDRVVGIEDRRGQPVFPNSERASETGDAGPEDDDVGDHDRSRSQAVLGYNDCVGEKPFNFRNAQGSWWTKEAAPRVVFTPFDKKKASLTEMRSHHLFPILTFLAGLAVGILSTGGYGKPLEPADTSEATDVADGRDGPVETESTRPSTENPSPAAALSATVDASVPVAADSESASNFEKRLQAMDVERARLQERVEKLERRLAASTETTGATGVTAERPSRPSTPEDRRSALVSAGVGEDRAADLVWRQGQQELDRLDLRDIAIREGWFGSDRYRDELSQIEANSLDMRKEIGEDFYDHYLFATGEDNRVAIDSIIPGSTAEEAGLQPGDLVELYAENRIFRFDDLRTATSDGERGELVPVRIRRGDDIVDAWLPRGPLGVRMDRTRVDPDT